MNGERDHRAIYAPDYNDCRTCKYGERTDCHTMAFWKMPVRERGSCNNKPMFVVACAWYVRKESK